MTTAKELTPESVAAAIRFELADYFSDPRVYGPGIPETGIAWIVGGVIQRLFPACRKPGEAQMLNKQIYLVIDHDGTCRERSASDMTKAATIKDILEGQFDDSGIAYVLCLCPDENSCRDVSEDIAREILSEIYLHGEQVPSFLEAWMEDQIGCEEMAKAYRELTPKSERDADRAEARADDRRGDR